VEGFDFWGTTKGFEKKPTPEGYRWGEGGSVGQEKVCCVWGNTKLTGATRLNANFQTITSYLIGRSGT